MFKSCSHRVRDLRWWGSLTMVPTGNTAKRLSSLNHTTKTIRQFNSPIIQTSENWPLSPSFVPPLRTWVHSCINYKFLDTNSGRTQSAIIQQFKIRSDNILFYCVLKTSQRDANIVSLFSDVSPTEFSWAKIKSLFFIQY